MPISPDIFNQVKAKIAEGTLASDWQLLAIYSDGEKAYKKLDPDGFLLITLYKSGRIGLCRYPQDDRLDAIMVVFNPDGSRMKTSFDPEKKVKKKMDLVLSEQLAATMMRELAG